MVAQNTGTSGPRSTTLGKSLPFTQNGKPHLRKSSPVCVIGTQSSSQCSTLDKKMWKTSGLPGFASDQANPSALGAEPAASGIAGDPFEVVPALTAALKAAKQ